MQQRGLRDQRSVDATPPSATHRRRAEEDSGLHDIRSLAQSTKQRICRRRIADRADRSTTTCSRRRRRAGKPSRCPSRRRWSRCRSSTSCRRSKRSQAGAKAAAAKARRDAVDADRRARSASRASRRSVATRTIAIVGIGLAAAAGVVLFVATRTRATKSAPDERRTARRRAGRHGASRPRAGVTTVAPQKPQRQRRRVARRPRARGAARSGAGRPTTADDARRRRRREHAPRARSDAGAADRSTAPTPVEEQAKPSTKPKAARQDDRHGKTDVEPTTTAAVKRRDDARSREGRHGEGGGAVDFDELLKEAGVDGRRRSTKPKLDKKSLSGDDFKHGHGARSPAKAQACYKGTQGTREREAHDRAVGPGLEGHGHAARSRASRTATASSAAVKGASFPAWDGGAAELRLPLSCSRSSAAY